MNFVKVPNDPVNASTLLVAKNTPDKIVKGLVDLGINVLFGEEIEYKVEAVRCHIDTQIAHIGEDRFVVSPLALDYYKKILPDAKLIAGTSSGKGSYPDDAAYNIASTGKFNIHNFKYTDKILLSKITGEKINVSQGYSKCSICIVNENSVITEDEGIATELKRHNIDVLKISVGDVLLPGLNYGFLGGASGKLSKDKLLFSGDIKTHRDYKEIFNFCAMRNVMPISLCEGNLIDIGSIIPVLEKE